MISRGLVPRNPHEVHGGLKQADVAGQGVLARLSRKNGDVTIRCAGVLDGAGLIVEIPSVLLENAERRKSELVHAGVAGAFEEKVGINWKQKWLGPGSADGGELRLDDSGRGGVRKDVRVEGVVLEHEVMAADFGAARYAGENDMPARLGWQRERTFGTVVEAAEHEAIIGEADLSFCSL